MIRIAEPDIGKEEEDLVLQAMRSGQLTQGPMVERLENLTAEMAGTESAVAVCNGTASLELILETLEVGPGDEVITTPFTFAATLNVIIRSGATPRFAEIGPDFNIDPDAVRALIGERTRGVIAVHLYGAPADAPRLLDICKQHGLSLIEDAAQAHGATVSGRPVGSFGVGSFSFYATKNVAAGEGGAITTSDRTLVERLRLLRNQGMQTLHEYQMIGTNRRMTELQAAIAIPQMLRIDQTLAARAANARMLTGLLEGSPVEAPSERQGTRSSWHQYTVLLPPKTDRDATIRTMHENGVEARAYYPRLVWDYPAYKAIKIKDDTPRARQASRRCLSLPVHQRLTQEELERIAEVTRSSLVQGRR